MINYQTKIIEIPMSMVVFIEIPSHDVMSMSMSLLKRQVLAMVGQIISGTGLALKSPTPGIQMMAIAYGVAMATGLKASAITGRTIGELEISNDWSFHGL